MSRSRRVALVALALAGAAWVAYVVATQGGSRFLTQTLIGLAVAGIYAIAASGLVVTYTASGIFNFAHGAFGMLAAYLYWQTQVDWGWPAPVAIVVVIATLAAFGAAVEAVIMRGLDGTAEVVRIVVPVSLMLALIGVANIVWPTASRNVEPFVEGGVTIGDFTFSYQRLIILGVAAVVAVGLRVFLYSTRTGIAMRAVVDDRGLTRLNGARPDRISMTAWALGAALAAVSGILVVSEARFEVLSLTLLVVQAYAVAAVGRLKSLPLTFLGAVVLGLATSYVRGYLPPDAAVGPIELSRLGDALPAILLFGAMFFLPQARLRAHSIDRVRGRTRVPTQRTALLGGVALVFGSLGAVLLMTTADVKILLPGFLFALVGLSLVPLTGFAGQISLAQMTFCGIGAVTASAVAAALTDSGWGAGPSILVAVLVAVATSAFVGAVVAVPALRLSGIYLALATAAFAMFMTAMVFNQQQVMTAGSRQVPPLIEKLTWNGRELLSTDRTQVVILALTFAVLGNLVVALRRSSWGRRLVAMRDSEVACATLGLRLTSAKVGVFAFSAGIAGCAGAVSGRTFIADDFNLLNSMPLTMMVVVGGVGAVAGAFLGGMLLGGFGVVSRVFETNAVGLLRFFEVSVPDLMRVAPGLIGINLGRNPDGMVGELGVGFAAARRDGESIAFGVLGVVGLWVMAYNEVIGGWQFAAAALFWVMVAVPLMPLVTRPDGNGRPAALEFALVGTVAVLALPDWVDWIPSNGLRTVCFLGIMLVGARVALLAHGPVGPRSQEVSPDLLGIDEPLRRSDLMEVDRVLGLPAGASFGVAATVPALAATPIPQDLLGVESTRVGGGAR